MAKASADQTVATICQEALRGAAVTMASSEKRASRAQMSPPGTVCLDILSPPPGDNDVMSHFERLSSNETKIAPISLRMVFGMAILQSAWLQSHSARERRSPSTSLIGST